MCFPPIDQVNPFAYSCGFTLHTSYKNRILDQRREGCQNAQKLSIIKAHLSLLLYKPVV